MATSCGLSDNLRQAEGGKVRGEILAARVCVCERVRRLRNAVVNVVGRI